MTNWSREKKSKPSSSTLPDLCLALRCKNSRKSGESKPVKEQQNGIWCIFKILIIKVLYRSSQNCHIEPPELKKIRPCWGAQKGDALGGAKHYFWIIRKFTCERRKLLKIVFIVQWCPVAGCRPTTKNIEKHKYMQKVKENGHMIGVSKNPDDLLI